jgi:hypothetical protein
LLTARESLKNNSHHQVKRSVEYGSSAQITQKYRQKQGENKCFGCFRINGVPPDEIGSQKATGLGW